MKIKFYLRYYTHFGQTLWISGNTEELGSADPAKAIRMTYLNNEYWYCILDIKRKKLKNNISYRYFLKQSDAEITWDGEKQRGMGELPDKCRELQFVDTWNAAGEFENVFSTAAFRDVFISSRAGFKGLRQSSGKDATHLFKVKAPGLEKNEVVCLLGSGQSLGSWSTQKPILLEKTGDWWTARVDLSGEGFPAIYKYGVFNSKSNDFIQYEEGGNRIIHSESSRNKITIVHDGFVHLPNTNWRAAGIAIPVFSLKSRNSFGVGEFTDLKLMVDWARTVGMKVIQLLPVNDTIASHDWTDSYPYSAISSFALHPIYINLSKVAGKINAGKLLPFKEQQKELNALPELDYEQVIKLKLGLLKELYELMSRECFESEGYKMFFAQNRGWLQPYAAYCYFRDQYGSSNTENWGTDGVFNEELVASMFLTEHAAFSGVGFYCFIQYHLHLQLLEAAEYARKKGVILKGDLPIGVNPESCECWSMPGYFNKFWQTGAPPDDFTAIGQNWGFPTYEWKKMEADGFEWWKERFNQMSRYFDAFRIDHVLGFFRIWSIPIHAVQGIMGRFQPAIPVSLSEFSENGIWYDPVRFCQPYITDDILEEIFNEQADEVKKKFLITNESGGYDLDPKFRTQKQVELYFSTLNDTSSNEIKSGLFELISNVILFPDESQADCYHFRIDMDKTQSFLHLIPHVQEKLLVLYEDYFFSRQDKEWKKRAMHILSEIKDFTSMLVCAEDLGMMSPSVPEVLQSLGILSLEVQRMPKTPGLEFVHPDTVPYLSVMTPGTHDMNTIRGWWQEDEKRTQRFYNRILGQWGTSPENCEAWISRTILQQILNSPAILSIFMLQDILGISETLRRDDPAEERINDPADPEHYWRYRMHITLEELIKQKEFNKDLKELIESSGR